MGMYWVHNVYRPSRFRAHTFLTLEHENLWSLRVGFRVGSFGVEMLNVFIFWGLHLPCLFLGGGSSILPGVAP